MTDVPDDGDLAVWNHVCEMATPGPWHWTTSMSLVAWPEPTLHGKAVIWLDEDRICCNASDKNFISVAREAVPILLGEVKRLQKQIIQGSTEIDRLRKVLCKTPCPNRAGFEGPDKQVEYQDCRQCGPCKAREEIKHG
jgi:hypothetical protein